MREGRILESGHGLGSDGPEPHSGRGEGGSTETHILGEGWGFRGGVGGAPPTLKGGWMHMGGGG